MRLFLHCLVLLATAAVLGCVPAQPVRYFALAPVAAPAEPVESEVAVGVAPIALASYLDRSGIVTRRSPNVLEVATLDNWIEPLDTQARRVVARNLAGLLGSDRVFVLPEQQIVSLDYVVEIALERFDIEAAGGDAAPVQETAVLEARWTLLAGRDRRLLVTAPARVVVPVAAPATFEQRAAAMSDALGRLSRTIATAIAGRRDAA